MSKITVDAYTGPVLADPPRALVYFHPDDALPAPGTQYRVTFAPAGPEPAFPYPRKNSNQAAILSKDLMFHLFLRFVAEFQHTDNDEDRARRFICIMCGIDSRAELDTNAIASSIFAEGVEKAFHNWLANREKDHAKVAESASKD